MWVAADLNAYDCEPEECVSNSQISHSDEEADDEFWKYLILGAGREPSDVRIMIDSLLWQVPGVKRIPPFMLSLPLQSPFRSVCPDKNHR
jgi:hypothetical protein